jgi:hypothetical protein
MPTTLVSMRNEMRPIRYIADPFAGCTYLNDVGQDLVTSKTAITEYSHDLVRLIGAVCNHTRPLRRSRAYTILESIPTGSLVAGVTSR